MPDKKDDKRKKIINHQSESTGNILLDLAKKLGYKEKIEDYANNNQWPIAIGTIASVLGTQGLNKYTLSLAAVVVFATFIRTTFFPYTPAELDKIKKRLEREEKIEQSKKEKDGKNDNESIWI